MGSSVNALEQRSTEGADHPSGSMDRVPPMLFTVDVASTEGETVLTLRGELDLFTQPRFMAALAGLDDGGPRVVLDLSELTFIDCANIAIIHRVRMLAGLRGTEFVLRSPGADVLRIMEMTGLAPNVRDGEVHPIVVAPPARAHDGALV
jgi:anti-anti-sigma factor